MIDGLYLAIDQGGQSTRAILFDRFGKNIASSRRTVATTRSADRGVVEHDAAEILTSVFESVEEVLQANSGPQVVAAGLATQRSSIVCWNKNDGEALSPVISWQDTRAADVLKRMSPGRDEIKSITGLVPSPHYGASKIRWCLEHLPVVNEARVADNLAIGPLSAFIVFHLTAAGVLLVDPANASRTLLWDQHKLDWSDKLLAAFDVPETILPRCVKSQHHFGKIKDTSIPLTVCTGDQNAAIFAGGETADGLAYLNIGTGAFVLAPVQEFVTTSNLLQSIIWVDEQGIRRAVEGTVNGAGSALTALNAAPDEINVAATAISADNIPLYLNGHSGLGSPYWRERFSSRLIGEADRAATLTAVLESILFLIQVNLEQISRSTRISRLVISGGLARNDALCQGMADLSGLLIVRPDEVEATAKGLAYQLAGRPSTWHAADAAIFKASDRQGSLRSRFSGWLAAMSAALQH